MKEDPRSGEEHLAEQKQQQIDEPALHHYHLL